MNCACFVQFKEQLGSVTNPEQKKNEVWERVVKDVLRSLTLSCLKFLCSLLRLRHRKLMFYRSLSVSVAVESKWERKAESDVCQGQAKAAFSNLLLPLESFTAKKLGEQFSRGKKALLSLRRSIYAARHSRACFNV